MKIEKHNSNDVRQILIGMIVDRTVLARISSKWSGSMFHTNWANLIGSWCIKYFNKYQKPPAKYIAEMYHNWAAVTRDKESIELIGEFLNSLSEEYSQFTTGFNSDYVIDLAGEHFNKVKLEKLITEIQDDIDDGKVTLADDRIVKHNRIELGIGEGIDLFSDKEAIREAFESTSEPLITFPGALGEFFGDCFERDGFVAFEAPEKRGKSLWLQRIARQAIFQRRKTAYFQAGDMSKNQVIRRWMQDLCKHPIKPCSLQIPTSIKMVEDKPDVVFETRTFTEGLDWRKAYKTCKEAIDKNIKSPESYLKLHCHYNNSLHVRQIESTLQALERENWLADVVIIDYADILDMTYSGKEGRDCINETWSQLRSISQKWHNLVITATQSNRESYSANVIKDTNTADDKRKNAHVTGKIGINQTDEEKKINLMRLNWIERREAKYSSNKCVYVAGSPEISNVAIRSCWK